MKIKIKILLSREELLRVAGNQPNPIQIRDPTKRHGDEKLVYRFINSFSSTEILVKGERFMSVEGKPEVLKT